MVLDPRKRQQKLERKAAKRNAELKARAQRNPTDLRVQFQNASAAPVLHSWASASLWNEGSGYVLLSREAKQRQIAFSAFMVDMYCLGVKDAMSSIRSLDEVNSLSEKLSQGSKAVKLKPECARKLVEGAVEYAQNLGFAPHSDYQRAKLIFGDIDATACTETFVYGHKGKPLYIAGPHETPQDSQHIIRRLDAQLGPQGHHFIVPGLESDLPPDFQDRVDRVRSKRTGR